MDLACADGRFQALALKGLRRITIDQTLIEEGNCGLTASAVRSYGLQVTRMDDNSPHCAVRKRLFTTPHRSNGQRRYLLSELWSPQTDECEMRAKRTPKSGGGSAALQDVAVISVSIFRFALWSTAALRRFSVQRQSV